MMVDANRDGSSIHLAPKSTDEFVSLLAELDRAKFGPVNLDQNNFPILNQIRTDLYKQADTLGGVSE